MIKDAILCILAMAFIMGVAGIVSMLVIKGDYLATLSVILAVVIGVLYAKLLEMTMGNGYE